MSRYIDADALIDTFEAKKAKAHDKSIKHLYGQNKNDKLYRKDRETESRCEYVLSVLRTTPTVDAVPVVHGEWIETEMGYDDYAWVCTVCGEPWVLNAGTPSENDMNYCPNCGAKMDGERKDGEHEL